MQSATAAPATPVQIAASLSPILLICRVPPGQVAETSVSSGVQISWQRLSQATSRSARRPEGAADPDGPAGPAGPSGTHAARRARRTYSCGPWDALRARRAGRAWWSRGTCCTLWTLRPFKTSRQRDSGDKRKSNGECAHQTSFFASGSQASSRVDRKALTGIAGASIADAA
jgi:hypothetical protein